jgi:hypothetical protein
MVIFPSKAESSLASSSTPDLKTALKVPVERSGAQLGFQTAPSLEQDTEHNPRAAIMLVKKPPYMDPSNPQKPFLRNCCRYMKCPVV